MEARNLKRKKKKTVQNTDTGITVTGKHMIQIPGDEKRVGVWFHTILLFITVTSVYQVFASAFAVSIAWWKIWPVLLIYSILFTIYFTGESFGRFRIFILLGAILAGVVLMLLTQRQFLNSLYNIANCVIVQVNRTYQGSLQLFPVSGQSGAYVILFVCFWLVWFLAKGMIQRQDWGHFMFVVFPVTAAAFLGGGELSVPALFLLLLSFLSITAASGIRVRKKFWGGEGTKEFQDNQEAGRRILLGLGMICGGAGVLLILAAFYLVRPGISVPVVRLSEAAAPVKRQSLQFLYEILPKISGGRLNLSLEGVGGGVSDGELGAVEGSAYDGVEALRVVSTVQPQETVYLKGFIGTEYGGDRWDSGDEDAFRQVAANWKTEDDPLLYIQNLPFLRMMYAQNSMEEAAAAGPAQLTVERLNANPEYTYVPYQAYLNDYYEMLGGDEGVAGQTAQDDIYSWYPVQEYSQVMSQWQKAEEQHGVLDSLEASYAAYVESADTKVPKEGLEKLKELCSGKKQEWDDKIQNGMTEEQLRDLEQEKTEDVKLFVIRTLWETCTFSAEAEKLPEGEDFIEYFMSDVKEGDSTAFASAAVMMFRMCGIPARYVVGYAAPSDLFSDNGDGTYSAVLQDDNAHAWPEIYISQRGWTPVETTPGFDGTLDNTEYSRADLEEQEESDEAKHPEEGEEEKEQKADLLGKAVGVISGKILYVAAAALLFAGWLIVRYIWIHNRRRGRFAGADETKRVKTIFYSFYEALCFAGFPEEEDTLEPEFAGRIAGYYPKLSEEDLRRYMGIVLRTHYSDQVPGREEAEFCLRMYERLVREAARSVKGKKMLAFLIWRAY